MEDVIWKISYGRRHMEDFLWKTSYGRRPMEDVIWKTSYGRRHNEDFLWNTSYERRPIEGEGTLISRRMRLQQGLKLTASEQTSYVPKH